MRQNITPIESPKRLNLQMPKQTTFEKNDISADLKVAEKYSDNQTSLVMIQQPALHSGLFAISQKQRVEAVVSPISDSSVRNRSFIQNSQLEVVTNQGGISTRIQHHRANNDLIEVN